MRRLVAGLVAGAGILAAGAAAAHVAPALDVDNRYLKVSLLGDRVRLAYTVYFGELPGAVQRRSMDTDGDGALSGAEADAFGAALAQRVAPAIAITLDGTAAATSWSRVDVGLGTPVVRGGAFSVDLIAWYCLPPGSAHTLALVDRYAIPRPGETEVRIEDGPAVHVEKATLGGEPLGDLDARWDGPGGPIAADGLRVHFVAGPAAPRPNDGRCRAPGRERPWLLPAALVVVGGGVGASGAAWWLRRRRGRRSGQLTGR